MSPPSTIIPGFACFGCDWQQLLDSKPAYEVVYIENLATSGPGSFHAALQNCKPNTVRFVIPKVSGRVDYDTDSNEFADCDNLVYAGQYAPSPGLYFRGVAVKPRGTRQLWMHFGCFGDAITQGNGHCINVYDKANVVSNIVILNEGDAYSYDGGVNAAKNAQNVSIVQSMSVYPTHWDGMIRQIILMGEDDGSADRLYYVRNVGTHFTARAPKVVETTTLISNNVFLNGTNNWTDFGKVTIPGISVNIVDNLYVYGQDSKPSTRPIGFDFFAPEEGTTADFDAHVAGNRTFGRDDATQASLILDNTKGHMKAASAPLPAALPQGYVSTKIPTGDQAERDFAATVCAHAGPRPNDRIPLFDQPCKQLEAAFSGGDSGTLIFVPDDHPMGYPNVKQNTCEPEVAGDCGAGVPGLSAHDPTAPGAHINAIWTDVWNAHCARMPPGATGC